MATLTEFIYLQLLDILTTIAFMMHGVGESNPIVRWAIREGPHPIWALFMLKGGAVLLALFCLYRSREKLLRKVNVSTPSRNVLFAAKQKCPVEAGRLEGRW